MRTLAIWVSQHGQPIVRAAVMLADGDPTHTDRGYTNQDGYFAATLAEVPYVEVSIVADGYQPYHATIAPIPTGLYDLRLTDVLVPIAPTVIAPHLEVRGNDFVDEHGQPACYSGVDQFRAFRLYRDGQHAELEALIKESLEFDFRWWRVLMMGSSKQNFILDLSPSEPGYYDDVRPFAEFLNTRGIGLLAECYADNQDVQAPVPGHWQQMADRLRGTTTILSGGNEWPKNGFDPQLLTDPGMIWSRGSSTADDLTPQNGATCASFHQRTDYPATITDATASAIYMAEQGYTVLMMDEPTRFDDTSNKSGVPDSERFAWQLARVYGTFWDLVVFHNYCGARCIPFTPNLRRVAAAWQRGLRSA